MPFPLNSAALQVRSVAPQESVPSSPTSPDELVSRSPVLSANTPLGQTLNQTPPRIRNYFETCASLVRNYLPNFSRPNGVPVATFNTQDSYQACTANRLNQLLQRLQFENINASFNQRAHGIQTVYEDSPETVRQALRASTTLTSDQKNMLRFFMYGEALSASELSKIFEGDYSNLIDQLSGLGIVVTETRRGETFYRLNNLSVESRRFSNGQTMFLLSELPADFRHDHGQSTAMISSTSFTLLHRIEQSYSSGNLRGVIADFGSGNGIQAIALLMMNPGIEEALALEVDPASMNLNRWNAMLNGVGNRIQVIDNSDADPSHARETQAFDRALRGRCLSLAVSNPPFNTVPYSVNEIFPSFGAGGEHGLNITNLFLWQALPYLTGQAEFLFYSQLAETDQEPRHLFLEESFGREGAHSRGFNVDIQRANFEIFNYGRNEYADILLRILPHFPHDESIPLPDRTQLIAEMRASHVGALRPAYVSIRPSASATQASTIRMSTAHIIPLENAYRRERQAPAPAPAQTGGIYEVETIRPAGEIITQIQAPEQRGGVFLQFHQVMPNGSDVIRDERRLEELLRQIENHPSD